MLAVTVKILTEVTSARAVRAITEPDSTVKTLMNVVFLLTTVTKKLLVSISRPTSTALVTKDFGLSAQTISKLYADFKILIQGYIGTGTECENINECTTGSNNCPAYSQCTDTVGSFECTCVEGRVLDRVFAPDTLNEIELTSICRDVDECQEGTDKCVNSDCDNSEGSYLCNCYQGSDSNNISEEF